MNNGMSGKEHRPAHGVNITDREKTEIRGVTDVVSFDEESVVLDTVCGEMEIEGGSLRVRTLDLEAGIVALDGRVDAIRYSEVPTAEKDGRSGILGRIFR